MKQLYPKELKKNDLVLLECDVVRWKVDPKGKTAYDKTWMRWCMGLELAGVAWFSNVVNQIWRVNAALSTPSFIFRPSPSLSLGVSDVAFWVRWMTIRHQRQNPNCLIVDLNGMLATRSLTGDRNRETRGSTFISDLEDPSVVAPTYDTSVFLLITLLYTETQVTQSAVPRIGVGTRRAKGWSFELARISTLLSGLVDPALGVVSPHPFAVSDSEHKYDCAPIPSTALLLSVQFPGFQK
ncbi:hypothetical protein BKA93DRAFT_750690 [Sparassis latifolia]